MFLTEAIFELLAEKEVLTGEGLGTREKAEERNTTALSLGAIDSSKPRIEEKRSYAGFSYLQTPHFPPSLAQCLQYLQFLQAWQGSAPVQVAAEVPNGTWLMRRIDNMI